MEVNEVYYGEVLFFDPRRGYGFISWEHNQQPQKDMFVHFSDIICEGFKTLYKKQKVSFQIGKNNNGQPKAINVQVMMN